MEVGQEAYSGRAVRRPLVGAALSVATGIYVASCGWLNIEFALVAAVFLLLFSCALRTTRFSSLLVFLSIGCVAACRFLVSDSDISDASINREIPSLPKKKVEIIGRVNGLPKYHAFKTGNRGMWIFPLRVEGMRDHKTWNTRRESVDVCVMGALKSKPVAQPGQRIRVLGELQKRNYRGGLPIGLKVPWPRYCVCISKPHYSLLAGCQHWRESAATRLEKGIKDMPLQVAVLRSLVLGYRNEIPSDTYDRFRRTGSLHIFAISGLHVGIVALLIVILLKSVGVPRDWFGVCLMPLLFFYVAATGMKASALRAMVMAGVFLLAPLFRRRADIPTSVAFAAILLLLLDPRQLLSAGFVFSFVVVAFIVMVYSALPNGWMKGRWIKTYGLSLVITSVAASLASMPMTAYYFGRFSPIALVGNLAVVPLTFFIVLAGWLSIFIPGTSVVFNHAAVVFINLMLQIVKWLDRIPGSSFKVAEPSALAIVLWYGSLIYLLVHARRRRQRYWALAGAGAAVLWAVFA